MIEEHPEMKPYEFTITGTVYAANESHARHFMYWTMATGAAGYQDASAAAIYDTKHEVKEREMK